MESKGTTTAKEEKAYESLLNATKHHSSSVKTLVAQSIPRFYAQFTKMQERAMDAQIDLLEDDNLGVRFGSSFAAQF